MMTPEQRSDQDLFRIIPSDPDAVRLALKDICDDLTARAVHGDLCSRVELVLAEVLNNIVEHANCDQPGAPITLHLVVMPSPEQNEISFTIIDNGLPMPGLALPERGAPVLDASDPETLPEGGFGWGLIRELTATLSYQRLPSQNRLSFTIATKG